MSKKTSKSAPRSFLKDPAFSVLDAAFREASEALKAPPVLKNQESNVTAHEATQIAKIETTEATEGVEDLVAITQQRLALLTAKLEILDRKKKAPQDAVGRVNAVQERLQKLKDIRTKLNRGDTSFLKKTETAIETNVSVPQQAVKPEVVPAKEPGPSSAVRAAPLIAPLNNAVLERPMLSSEIGLRMAAQSEAQSSARKLIRSAIRTGHHLTPIDEGLNTAARNGVGLSGGSTLDGSYYETGVTYEDILGAARLSPTAQRQFPQPNFDETDIEIENNLPPAFSAAKADATFLPPLQFPSASRTATLGQIPKASVEPIPRMSNIFPARPVLTSSIGQQLNKK